MDIYRDICGGIFGHMGYHLYDNSTQDPAAKRQDKHVITEKIMYEKGQVFLSGHQSALIDSPFFIA